MPTERGGEPTTYPEDGYCYAREDETHCVHWWDDPEATCCSCGYVTPTALRAAGEED